MSDIISRKAAVDAVVGLIDARYEWEEFPKGEVQGLISARYAIEDLPSVKPDWAEIDSGAIELELPIDVSQVKRIIVKQKDSHWCGVYYLGGHEE